MKKAIFYITVLTLLISCSKKDNEQVQQVSEEPEIPESRTYDLNIDSVDDLNIGFSLGVWDGARASGLVYSGRLEAIGENRFLSEYRENVSTTYLFAQFGDTIQRESSEAQNWDSNYASLTRLWQDGDGVWSNEWSIGNEDISNPYYVGVQIKEGNELLLGWLKLDIDKTTGDIEIIDHELTSENSMVIAR